MRISDWSSDVCSSVLARRTHRLLPQIPWVGIGKALLAVLQAVTIADRAPIRHGIAIKRLPDHLMRDASRLARGLLLPRFVALGGGEAADRRFSTASALEYGRGSRRARGCKYVVFWVVAGVYVKKKNTNNPN